MEVIKQWVEPAESGIDEVVEVLQMQRREVILEAQQWQPSLVDTSIVAVTSSDGSLSSSPTSELGSLNGKTEDMDSKSTKSTRQKFITEIVDSEEDEKSQKHSVTPTKKVQEEEDDLKSKLKLIKEMLGEDEEIVELEFETAVKHIDNHDNATMYCPNCSSCITKVLIRKKKVVQPKTPELLGCFSCFSLFIPSGDGIKLWPFGRSKTTQTSHQQITQTPPAENVIFEGNCFSMFDIFGNGKRNKKPQIDDNNNNDVVSDEVDNIATNTPPEAEEQHEPSRDVKIDIPGDTDNIKPINEPSTDPVHEIPNKHYGTSVLHPSSNVTDEHDNTGDVGPLTPLLVSSISHVPEPTVTIRDSKSVEIVKSIVYGGLMELIASLSIISSAAASGATTLNIISIAMANIIGGLIIIFHNLGDLKNEQVARYQEILGRRENFLLHATFVILSFLLFGLIPPTTYAFTFRTNDDTDLKLAAVAAASLLCIIILAICKAYICNQPRFYAYFKTIMYYIVIAISVSGISYVVGDYISILVGRLGWFETSSAVVPEVKSNQAWVSY